jgi:MFS family permease
VPLRSRPLLALLAAEAVSTTGSQLTWLAVPWFVLETTGSPTRMSLVLAAEFLGTAVVGIPSGAVAARLGARRMLLACDLVRAPLVALVPLLHSAELLTLPLLAAISFLLGALWTPSYASQRVILPELVGEEDRLLGQANALLRATTSTTVLVGPPLAGFLIAALGASNVLWLDAGTFLVSFALVTLFVPAGERPPQEKDAPGLFAGLRFLWRDKLLRPWTLAFAGFELGWQALFAVIPVLAFLRFDDPTVAGWLWAALGAAGIAGNAPVVVALPRFDPYLIVVAAKAAQLALFWLLPLDLPVAAFGATVAAASFLASVIYAPVTGIQTTRAPASVRPHAMAAYLTITLVAGTLGLAAAGPVVDHQGFRALFVAIALIHTIGSGPFILAALRERAERPPGPPATASQRAGATPSDTPRPLKHPR